MSRSVLAATIKISWTEWLKQQTHISHSSGGEKVKTKSLTDLVSPTALMSGDDLLAVHSQSSSWNLTWQKGARMGSLS